MDSSVECSDTESAVFSSSESSAEQVKNAMNRKSGSVSSLAEKFEKLGDCVKSENEDVTESGLMTEKERVKTEIVPENVTKDNSGVAEVSSVEDKVKIVLEDTLQNLNKVEGDEVTPQLPKMANVDEIKDISIVQKVTDGSCHSLQQSTSLADADQEKNMQHTIQDNMVVTEKQKSKPFEGSLAFLAEKIAQSMKKSVASSAGMEKNASSAISSGGAEKIASNPLVESTEIVGQTSLKDSEQSSVTDLNIENSDAATEKKTPRILAVPSIEITEASDQEEISSEVREELNSKKNDDETEVKRPIVNDKEETETKLIDDNVNDPTPTSTSQNFEGNAESEINEERKAHFYISSGNSSVEPPNDSLQNSAELRQRTVNTEDREEFTLMETTDESKEPSCLCSKTIHKVVSLICYIVALLAFILYSMAHQGKVPNFYELVGSITAVIAFIIGSISFICCSIMEFFPIMQTMYQRLNDFEITSHIYDNEESPVSEGSQNGRPNGSRQNGPSTDTGGASMRCADQRELVDKAKKIKEVLGLIDSFSELVAKLEPLDKVSEMEIGESGTKSKFPQKVVKDNGEQTP